MLTRESCRLALAESQSILRAQEIERVAREMEAIGRIRAQRIANKANRFRRNSISAAACLSCCAAGFLIAVFFTHTSGTPIPKISAQTKNSQWTGKVLDASSQSIDPIVISSSPLPQTAKTITTAPIQVVKVDPLPAPASGKPTPQVQPLARTITPPVIRFTAQARPNSVLPKVQTVLMPMAVAATVSIKPPEKKEEDSEFVLPVKASQKEAVVPKFQEKASIATGSDFKVVNVIDGALIVRQGEAVRQFQIGDQLPSGKTLKSVNAENGKFEVVP